MSDLKVTNVKFWPRTGNGALKAFADVEFNGEMTVKGFSVFSGQNGIWAKAPSDRVEKNGETQYYPRIMFRSTGEEKSTHPVLKAIVDAYTGGSSAQTKSTPQPADAGLGSDPW